MDNDDYLNNAQIWIDDNEMFGGGQTSSESEGEEDNEPAGLANQLVGQVEEEELPILPVDTAAASQISSHVTNALSSKKNFIVECPPGLQRSMNILRAALDFYRSAPDADKPLKIYFATTGFTEMTRLLEEIKDTFETTPQLQNVTMAILGDRSNLCCRTTDGQGQVTCNEECRRLVQNYHWNVINGANGRDARETCDYYQNSFENQASDNLFSFTEENRILGDGMEIHGILVRDIEDYGRHGREVTRCPYFDTKPLHLNAQLVICPIDYLLSPVLQREHDIQLNSAIVIFDDAYDIEAISCNEGSIKMSVGELHLCSEMIRSLIEDIRVLRRSQQLPDISLRIENQINNLVGPLNDLSNYVRRIGQESARPPAQEIIDELLTLNISGENASQIIDVLHNLSYQHGIDITKNELIFKKLKKFVMIVCLSILNSGDYHFIITEQEGPNQILEQVIKITCANAAITFGSVRSATSSIILAGDCLAPIPMLRMYLGVDFQEVCQVAHDNPAANDSYFLGYCRKGPNNQEFALNYHSRNDSNVIREVAESIVTFCREIPNGLIILFHSRRYFSQIIGRLNSEMREGVSLMNHIRNVKHVVSEFDRGGNEESKLNEYKSQTGNNPSEPQTGAVLFCWARGNLYKRCRVEKLMDEEVRGIIHVSMTYAAWHYSDLIVARRNYFDNHPENEGEPDNGNHRWYESEAFRVSNQAFGQCVQHSDDWGIVVVLDHRMFSRRHLFQEYLPAWVRQLRRNRFIQRPFDQLIRNMQAFIRGRVGGNGN